MSEAKIKYESLKTLLIKCRDNGTFNGPAGGRLEDDILEEMDDLWQMMSKEEKVIYYD